MTHHPGYEKNQSRPGAHSRNGYSTKTVITDDGPLELRTPRDRDGTFEPQLVKKNQPRITGMDNQILSLYAKGMTTREIAAAFKELYDADVSPALISKVTDAVMEQVVEWQNRPLDAVYPRLYRSESSAGQSRHQQIGVPGTGHQYRRSERTARYVAGRK